MSLRRAFHSGVIACAASLIGGNIASQLPAQTWNPEVFGPGEQARAAEAAIREGIEPVATIGVPEGLHFRAQIAWMQPSSLAVPPPEWLVVNVVAVGAGAEDMVNYGHLRVGRVHTDTGEWLRMTEMAPDPYRMFIRIRRDPHSLHPEKAIWIPIRFRRPNKRVGSIPELEMQVVMNRAVASREIVIQDVESFVQDRPRDADLRQLRVRLKPVRVHYENGFRWDLDCLYDPDRLIRRLVLVDETGDEVQFGFSTPHGLTWQHWVLSGDNWPADGAIKIDIVESEAVPVTVRFRDLPVPHAPPLAPERGRLDAWRQSRSAETPPELLIDGQARWRQETRGLIERIWPRLAVEVRGAIAQKIVAVGYLKLDSVTANGARFEVHAEHPSDELRDRWMETPRDNDPPDGVQFTVDFLPVEAEPESIDEVVGSIRALLAERREVVVKDALSRNGDVLNDPALDAAGLKLRLVASRTQYEFEVLEGDPRAVAAIFLDDAEGVHVYSTGNRLSPLVRRPGLRTPAATPTLYVPPLENLRERHPEFDPSTAGLRLIVYVGISELEIPFHFEELPFPPRPEPRLP